MILINNQNNFIEVIRYFCWIIVMSFECPFYSLQVLYWSIILVGLKSCNLYTELIYKEITFLNKCMVSVLNAICDLNYKHMKSIKCVYILENNELFSKYVNFIYWYKCKGNIVWSMELNVRKKGRRDIEMNNGKSDEPQHTIEDMNNSITVIYFVCVFFDCYLWGSKSRTNPYFRSMFLDDAKRPIFLLLIFFSSCSKLMFEVANMSTVTVIK